MYENNVVDSPESYIELYQLCFAEQMLLFLLICDHFIFNQHRPRQLRQHISRANTSKCNYLLDILSFYPLHQSVCR